MSNWQLIYETDDQGAVVSGSLSGLRAAAMHAADVKVMYYSGNNWWSRECSSVCVYGTGRGTVVSATYCEALDTERDGKGLSLASPVTLEYQIYNSTGWIRSATGGEIDAERQRRMRWYVRDYFINWIINAEVFELISDRNP
jgi:hypothetical protein